MSLDALPFNAFDLFVVVFLLVGLYKGRRNGMSGELISLAKWLAIMFGCAAAYEPLGSLFATSTNMFSHLFCYLMAYIGAALVIVLLFIGVHRALGGKLIGSDAFGSSEYYLGMISCFLKFACILFVGLALLNARYFSPTEVKAMEKYQDQWYGSNFFPGLHSLQDEVFQKSLTGTWIRDNLAFLLIKPTETETKELHQKEAKWN